MKKILINTDPLPYEVCIGENFLKDIGLHVKKIIKNSCKVVLITDANVNKMYASTIDQSFKKIGLEVFKFIIAPGEKSKNLLIIQEILDFLSENQITKNDIILACGGGVVGDISGFAASIYLRGIKFINIPTTLLAAVDSSVGGKTGVNLLKGKNLVGSFWQPLGVMCDYDTFSTLNNKEISNGISEIIKYAVIKDKNFFEFIKNNNILQHLEYVISTCVKIKSDFVTHDEFDKNERQKLNFGHTLGHAIEKCSNFEISHGNALAIGMSCIIKASVEIGICEKRVYRDVLNLFEKYNLPTECNFSVLDIYEAVLNDKKRIFDKINFIVISEIGNSQFFPLSIKENEVLNFIKIAVK